jgi:hypothetical protein
MNNILNFIKTEENLLNAVRRGSFGDSTDAFEDIENPLAERREGFMREDPGATEILIQRIAANRRVNDVNLFFRKHECLK